MIAPRAIVGSALVAGVAAAIVAQTPDPGRATPWGDSATVTGTSLVASTVPAPANFACTGLGLLSLKFSWDAVPGATGYTVYYAGQPHDTVDTSLQTASLLAGGTAWVVANTKFGSTTWTSAPSATRSYRVLALAVCG